MPRGEGTGYVRKAKRRQKLDRMIELYPDEADKYRQMQKDITAELRSAGVCIYCGRQLKGEVSTQLGLGKDCAALLEEMGVLEEWTNV